MIQDLPDEIILKVFFDSVGKKQKQIHLCTSNFEKQCTAKIACMMAVILLNLNLGLQDSLSSEPCVLNLLKIYFARLHALVRICSLLSMPRFCLGFQAFDLGIKITIGQDFMHLNIGD